MKVVTEQYNNPSTKPASSAPITLTWNNARMIRNHSIQAVAREILNANITSELVKVNLIGSPSTGKTTCGKLICHLIHELADKPYVVKIFNREDLMNFESILSSFQPMNHVLMFDDISWLSAGNTKAKIDQLQKTFTEIRHLPGGKDVKIIIIFNFHYNYAIPKHLRQADFFMYFDIGSSELDNMQKIVGAKNTKICLDFIRIKHQVKATSTIATTTEPEYQGNFSYAIGKYNKFTYQHRAPFAPALFWNLDTVRHVVFPSREWLKPICHVCSKSSNAADRGDILKLKEIADKTYGESRIRNAFRVILLQQGINTYPSETLRAVHWVEKEMSTKYYSKEEIIEAWGLEEIKTYSKQPSVKDHEKMKEEEEII